MSEHPAVAATDFSPLAEQFDDLTQQREAGALGMWIFLATEVLLFGALFAGYAVYRQAYPEAFREAARHLYMSIGVINTAVLLTSSLFVAIAVHAAQVGHRRSISVFLGLAILLGLVFLGLKALEYYLDWREHIIPWGDFRFPGPHAPEAAMFFVFYFIMTVIHAIHMIVGISVLAVIAFFAWRGHYGPDYHNPVEISGLYWHFVDIVWIFLLPTFYLVSASS